MFFLGTTNISLRHRDQDYSFSHFYWLNRVTLRGISWFWLSPAKFHNSEMFTSKYEQGVNPKKSLNDRMSLRKTGLIFHTILCRMIINYPISWRCSRGKSTRIFSRQISWKLLFAELGAYFLKTSYEIRYHQFDDYFEWKWDSSVNDWIKYLFKYKLQLQTMKSTQQEYRCRI